jgi:AmiR/NasT family two-component response regulator
MAGASKVVAVKEEGTHPPAEGMLARFARVQAVKSGADAFAVAKEHPHVVLIDSCMPTLEAQDIVEALRGELSHAVIMLVDFEQSPGKLRRQLSRLATLVAPHHGRPLDIPRIIRVLDISQEGLSRILNVSAKTAHRWMKGARPRAKPELERLSHVISLLLETLPNEEAIRSYLNHPNPNFNGDTAMNLLVRGEFDRVAADIEAVREGVYV